MGDEKEFNSLRYVFEQTKLPGETLREFTEQWKALSDKDKNDLRTWAKAEASA